MSRRASELDMPKILVPEGFTPTDVLVGITRNLICAESQNGSKQAFRLTPVAESAIYHNEVLPESPLPYELANCPRFNRCDGCPELGGTAMASIEVVPANS